MADQRILIAHPDVEGGPIKVTQRAFDATWAEKGWELAAPAVPVPVTAPVEETAADPDPELEPVAVFEDTAAGLENEPAIPVDAPDATDPAPSDGPKHGDDA